MSTRRKFLQQGVLSSAGMLATGKLLQATAPAPAVTGATKPIVISTWNFAKAANEAAWTVLSKNGHALDAVETGVKVPEADPLVRSVGYGGIPDRDGRVTLDACIMDDKYNCGSVMCLEFIKHPISVARLIMEKTPHIILTGEGALRFALAHGFKKENLLTPWSENYWREWLKKSNYSPVKNVENQLYDKTNDPMPGGKENHDTIGMLALDQEGRLSGACTTSGLSFKMQGRVGDSPIIGAGLYVDPEVGGATATGVGEEVIRVVGSHLIVELMRQGSSPEAACKEAVERIISRNPAKAKEIQVGFLAMNKNGEYGAYALQTGFTFHVKSNTQDQFLTAKNIY
ncbi:MAG TPA: N(4)-(beta-N-acetylglucosaminyl)-L-asparaginase [Pseudobacter sp.]|nr:N(4)-(beta-N-acetylglucosaminyl)-L-asparaginase [Pseudobacter sp.]